jgi:O-succinylbenzoate synthase
MTTAIGRCEKLETVLVALHGGGATGWGEASPGNAPLAGGEWAAGAFAVLRDWLAPAVVGSRFDSGKDLGERLKPFCGNPAAKAALDAAWWDLQGRLQGKPLHELLGGRREAVEVGPTFDKMDSVDDFRAAIAEAVEAGFARVKLKFRPGWDVHMVDFVRKEFPSMTFHIDCEGDLGLGQMEMLYRLEDFSLAMIEQPLPAEDLVGNAMVQDSLRTPIGLDESITSVKVAEMALDLHSGKFMSLKPSRVGGLTSAVAIHDACRGQEVRCWVGAAPQSTVGARAGFALAAKENCTYPADYFVSDRVLAEDVAEPLLPSRDASDGRQRVRLWAEPGIGIEPDRKVLEACGIAHVRIG